MWKSYAQLAIERESLDHIMHGDSSIKNKELTKILIEGVIDHAYLRGIVVTLHVPIWKWLVMISIEIEYQLKVFEVENTWYTKMSKYMST